MITSYLRTDRSMLLSHIEEIYKQIGAADLSEPMQDEHQLEALAQEDLARIGSVKDKRVLEIGPGRGVLFKLLRQDGGIVSAADLASCYLHQLDQLDTHNYLLDIQDPRGIPTELENNFDVVVLTDVLEHLLLPADALLNCKKLLKTGGLLYIRVPTHESLISYSQQLGCPFPLVHVRTYSKAILSRELKAAGFRLCSGPSTCQSAQRVPRSSVTSSAYWSGVRTDLEATWSGAARSDSTRLSWISVRSALFSGGANVSHPLLKRFFRFIAMPVTLPGAIYCVATK